MTYMPRPIPPQRPRSAPATPPQAGAGLSDRFENVATASLPAYRSENAPHTAFDINLMTGDDTGTGLHFFLWDIAPGSLATQVMRAAVTGDTRTMAALLKRPEVLPDFANIHGVTPLMAAAARGHIEIVELLLAEPLVNASRQAPGGWTALHYAAHFGKEVTARSLIAHHAPLDAETVTGQLPHMIAAEKPVAAAFWQSRNFTRFMKNYNPAHPKLQLPPAPVVAAEETVVVQNVDEKQPTAPDVLTLIDGLARMKIEEFKPVFEKMMAKEIPHTVDKLFIAAAAQGNTGVMDYLRAKIFISSETLDRALAATIREIDRPEAAHRLMLWGTDPDSPEGPLMKDKKSSSILQRAFAAQTAGAFEEMVLWGDSTKDKEIFSSYLKRARIAQQGSPPVPESWRDKSDNKKLVEAVELWEKKQSLRRTGTSKLQNIFCMAAARNDIVTVMAAYAEARADRILRGTVRMNAAAGGSAIGVALINKRYAFARKLIADGYRLADAPADLLRRAVNQSTAYGKKLAEDHLSGKMVAIDIEKIAPPRTDHHGAALYMMPPTMSRYGMM